MVTVEKGAVIRVRDWPGTLGERYVVDEIREVEGSPYPQQVYAHRLEALGSDGVRTGSFRAFPLDRCTVDEKATRAYRARRDWEAA